jgi:hypothetical protein
MSPKSNESQSQPTIVELSKKLVLPFSIALSIGLGSIRACAEVPVGNLTPFDTATMQDTNAGIILQNFNGQPLNGAYLRTDSQQLGITKTKDPKINMSVLFRDNDSQNYQLNTKVGDFYPYVNFAVNQGEVETATGVFAEFKPFENVKITGVAEIGTSPSSSKPDILLRGGLGIKF